MLHGSLHGCAPVTAPAKGASWAAQAVLSGWTLWAAQGAGGRVGTCPGFTLCLPLSSLLCHFLTSHQSWGQGLAQFVLQVGLRPWGSSHEELGSRAPAGEG